MVNGTSKLIINISSRHGCKGVNVWPPAGNYNVGVNVWSLARVPETTFKVSENDSLRQPAAAHSEERPRPQKKSSRSQRRLNALTPGYLKGTVVRSHPMAWSLGLCPDYTKQDSVVYGAEFGVVFLAKDPRTASIEEGLDCLRLNNSDLEGERDFRLVVELPYVPPDAHPGCGSVWRS